MKTMKKVWGVLLAAALLVTMFTSTAFAAVSVPASQTLYLRSKNGTSWLNVSVDGLTKKQTVTKSSIKSSNTSILVPIGVFKSLNEYSGQYINKKYGKDYSGSNVYSSIEVEAKKAGTANISFKIGNKTYNSKVTVKKYVNPASSITIPGVNGGKNIASKYKSESFVNGKQGKTVKSGKISVKAAKGWKVTRIEVYDRSSEGDGISYWSTKGAASVSAPLAFGLKANGKYDFYFTFKNTKDNAEINLSYSTGN